MCAALMAALHATAQITGNGYYRVQNKETGRYIELIDNRGKIDYVTTTVDLGALQTIKGFDQVVNNPATVFYITDMGNRNYNLSGQGCDLYGRRRQLLRPEARGERQAGQVCRHLRRIPLCVCLQRHGGLYRDQG